MILTKRDLKEYQENMRIWIPDNLAQELLERYGTYTTDDEGHVFEYTEQDIYEQIGKMLRDKGCITF